MTNKFFNHYLKIIKLNTGYKTSNKYFLLFIVFISIISLLLRQKIMHTFPDNLLIINSLFCIIILNIIFLQFNLGCRITLILGKGIPYFYKEINSNTIPYIKSYSLAYLIYNISLMLLSVLILNNLYLFLGLQIPNLINLIYWFSLLFSYILYRVYFEYNFNKYLYKIEYNLVHNFRFLDKLLLSIFPIIILMYLCSSLAESGKVDNEFILTGFVPINLCGID